MLASHFQFHFFLYHLLEWSLVFSNGILYGKNSGRKFVQLIVPTSSVAPTIEEVETWSLASFRELCTTFGSVLGIINLSWKNKKNERKI